MRRTPTVARRAGAILALTAALGATGLAVDESSADAIDTDSGPIIPPPKPPTCIKVFGGIVICSDRW
jgi:hypothetical protein